VLPFSREAHQHPVAIISHQLWRNALGGRADVLGADVTIDRTPYTVIGVAPDSFRHHRIGEPAPDLWVPLVQYPAFATPENWAANRDAFWVEALGRLRPGAAVGEASAVLATVFERLAKEYPDTNRERGAAGQRDLAIRAALGASRRRILTGVLRDGLRLATPGLAVGLVAASGFTFAVQSMLLGVAPLNPAAFGLTAVAVLTVVLLACAVRAARAAGVDPSEALRTQ